MDIHTAEPLVPEPSLIEVEIAIGKLKTYKSQGWSHSDRIDQSRGWNIMIWDKQAYLFYME
jgi:hypothetical protein